MVECRKVEKVTREVFFFRGESGGGGESLVFLHSTSLSDYTLSSEIKNVILIAVASKK